MGKIFSALGFFPGALALTTSLAAALAINDVIGLYVELYKPPKPEPSQTELSFKE